MVWKFTHWSKLCKLYIFFSKQHAHRQMAGSY